MRTSGRPGSISRLAAAGLLALALLATACSNGTDVAAEADASVAATVEAIKAEEAATPEHTANCPFGFRKVPAGTLTQDLSCVDLGGLDLSGARFKPLSDLTGALMSYADLSCANLSCANLTGANLTGANLRGADLRRAELYRAILTGADLNGARCNDRTSWPDGSTGHGSTCPKP